MKQLPTISIIVTTFNRPDALRLILIALAEQTDLPDEVIIADDGSTQETQQLITHFQTHLPYRLKSTWQKDKGFRAAKIRNQAALKAEAQYLIFLDGDCVPFTDFVEKHRQLAEPDWFVSGHRILLNKRLTEKILHHLIPIYKHSNLQWLRHYVNRDANQLFPLLRVNLPKLRKLTPRQWQGVKSCNLAIWKDDFFSINGFDERFIGWGYEDSDLVIRLIKAGIYRKSGKLAVPVIHLWHPLNDRDQEYTNLKRLQKFLDKSYKG